VRWPSIRRDNDRVRWRRFAVRSLIIVLLLAGAGIGTAAGYVASVPLPRDPAVPQASELYYRDGSTILGRVGVNDRTDVPLDRIPLPVRRAVLAAEDRDFYGHVGVSGRGVVRAVWSDLVSGETQGASTITQQYVRNAYLTQERSLGRKAKEAALALKIERRYGKDELLRRYLNTIYFGRGAYGIQAAAQAYFGLTVDRLTYPQGAVLAAVIKDPWNFDPAVDARAARDRWSWILDAMAAQGWITHAEAAGARYPDIAPRSPGDEGALGLVVDAVEQELARHGVPPQLLHTAGLRVVTTIDAGAEQAALEAVRASLHGQPTGLRAALVAVEPATGAVRAYYGGDQGRGFFDDAVAVRPPASTFKPFVLAAGLRKDISYESRWDGSSPRTFQGRLGVPLYNRDDLQCPDCTLDRAMARSLNTPFYAVAERVGPSAIRQVAVDLGIPPAYQGKPSLVDQPGDPRPGKTRPDIALGRYPVAPVDLASAYATLAAGGVHHDRYLVESVAAAGSGQLYAADPARRVALSPAVAADVTAVLAHTLDEMGGLPGRPAAAKTGTQQWADTADNQDAWMAGYTPQLAAVVWLGRAEPGPIRDTAGKPIQGDGLPAGLWRSFMSAALTGYPAPALPSPAHLGRVDVGDAGTGTALVNTSAGKRPAPVPEAGTSRSVGSSRAPAGATASPRPPAGTKGPEKASPAPR
jgi:membrane peptidoglycan carboxypeptidase